MTVSPTAKQALQIEAKQAMWTKCFGKTGASKSRVSPMLLIASAKSRQDLTFASKLFASIDVKASLRRPAGEVHGYVVICRARWADGHAGQGGQGEKDKKDKKGEKGEKHRN